MKLQDIHIRDPFILLEGGRYYLYGSRGNEAWGKATGLDVYESDDLVSWSGPSVVFTPPEGFWADMHFWAPEVHQYHGKFYMFVSFKSETACRGTQIMVADTPKGPFTLHSDGPVTPRDWECLDGTLYIDRDGKPYMVFCHEWLQVKDGEMCAVRLSDDLKQAVGEPFLLFRASEPDWALKDKTEFVTDGPWMYRTASGKLLMLWSSSAANGYVEAIAYSDNGDVTGRWQHQKQLLFDQDGGHGMIFTSKEGKLFFILHNPNNSPMERPVILPLEERDGTLAVIRGN
ncbi:MAG TPA: family 43 glycosylhydrolase [Candidatus Faecivivens stercorigallinarum]|nr:family 43 glycosylhydrolase [Candidatus Faecivivens stercorigallinarum]